MATEQQSVQPSSSNSNNSSTAGHKKTSVRNASSRHSSACGGGQWYPNGDPGVQFVPHDVHLNFAPVIASYVTPPPGALYDYGCMLNSPEMSAWAAVSEPMQLLGGAPLYDPAYATAGGGFLSPTLVNSAAFTPVSGPAFAYDAHDLFNACGMTPTPTAMPSFPFDPALGLAPAPWENFSTDYPAWPSASGAQPEVASETASQPNAEALPNGGDAFKHAKRDGKSGSNRSTQQTNSAQGAELASQLSLLRVANPPTQTKANGAASNSSYAAALLSKTAPLSNSTSATPGEIVAKTSETSSVSATVDESGAKAKLLSVAKRREITYAGVVKAGHNDSAESKPVANATLNQNANGFVPPRLPTSSHPTNHSASCQQNGWLPESLESPEALLDKLKSQVNPPCFPVAPGSRFFVIKSYSEDDVHRSIKYGIWCSTVPGNKKLDAAYRAVNAHDSRDKPNGATASNATQHKVVGLTYPVNQPLKSSKHPGDKPSDAQTCKEATQHKPGVYLFFSVNGSGHFCGVAEMTSAVDYETRAGVWEQDKWRGKLDVRWHFVKDVPNSALRNVRLENNENKPVTNSRDTQEVPLDKAQLVLQVFASYPHTTSLFDDFLHYEQKQHEANRARAANSVVWNNVPQTQTQLDTWRTMDDWNTQVQPSDWWPHASWASKMTARGVDWHSVAAAAGNDHMTNTFTLAYLAPARSDAQS